MATEDTNTAPRGECQIEVWGERVDAGRSQVLAPACGLTKTLEFDTGVARGQGSGVAISGLIAGLKWVPGDAAFETALGTVGLGAEAGISWAGSATEHWRVESLAVVGLGSWAIGSAWNLYANLSSAHRLSDGKHFNGTRVAVAWQPIAQWLLFVESLASNDSKLVRNAGMRFWVVPDALGLDIVAARSSPSGTSLSIGLGWYGLRLP